MALVGSAVRVGARGSGSAVAALWAQGVGLRQQSTLPPGVVTVQVPRERQPGGKWPLLPLVTVPATEKWITERGGTYARTLEPGTSFLVPFVEKVVYKGPGRSQLVDVGKVGAFCRDGGHAMAEAAVAYSVKDMQTMYYSVQDHARFIRLSTRMVLGHVLAKRTVLEGLQDRTAISKEVTAELNKALEPLGMVADTVLVTDFQPEPVMAAALQSACTDRITEEQQEEFQQRRHNEKLKQLEREQGLNSVVWKSDMARIKLQQAVDKVVLEEFLQESKPLIEELAPLMEKPGASEAANFLVQAYSAIGRRQGLSQSLASRMMKEERDRCAPVAARPQAVEREEELDEAAEDPEGEGMSMADLEAFEEEYEGGREKEVEEAAQQEKPGPAEDMTREEAERLDLEQQKQQKEQKQQPSK